MRRKYRKRPNAIYFPPEQDLLEEPFVIGIRELNEINGIAIREYLDSAQWNYLDESKLLQIALTLKGLEKLLTKHALEVPYKLKIEVPKGKDISGKKP